MRLSLRIVAALGAVCLAAVGAGLAQSRPEVAGAAAERTRQRIAAAGPNGYEIDAYLDCGVATETKGAGGTHLRQMNGQSWNPPEAVSAAGPIGTMVYDPTGVVYAAQGLRPGTEYVLGFTWWDFDNKQRQQSVRFGTGEPVRWTTVLPTAAPLAYSADQPTWAQIHLPITEAFRKSDRLLVGFHRDGPADAVVSEVWLLRKKAGGDSASRPPHNRVGVVTGDEYPGHPWRETAPELAAILRTDPRLEVTVIESPMILASPLLGHFDALVLNYVNWKGRPDPGPPVWSGLRRYVESGKGLVIVHFACGAFREWSDYVKVAGRVWNPQLRGHDPYGSFQVRITDGAHPLTAGLSDFGTKDELYTCLDGDTPIQVLARATSVVDHKDYPMAFVHQVGRGRVFHCPLGHDLAAFKSEGARELYRRGTAWAAGVPPTADK